MSALALRGPAWLVARQHGRTLGWGAVALVLLIVVRLVLLGWTYVDVVQTCMSVIGFLPALFGLFVAGPMIARDLESGAYRLLWTQSVSPARWLTAKLALPAAGAVATMLVLAGLCRWALSFKPDGAQGMEWYADQVYPLIGPLGAARALAYIAIGALVGILVRRTIPAMVASFVAIGIVEFAFNFARGHLGTATTLYSTLDEGMRGAPGIFVADGNVTSTGAKIGDACVSDQCMREHDISGYFNTYIPHFWPTQLIETGLVLAVAALALTLTFRLLRTKAAS
ncbi:hypothetical protein [Streptomyces beijiangensis]|uniref:ABC-2 family transporter protein n=1 Tax=Streptomyces beijiangensis TaxID=163361 RepID=A0A939F7Z8_9ACTN|nr:hypothetical protein [Streptomyces beijiangensis]MBO0512637.1 hypothetical protein [Streptomyces beijiangensis]